MKWFTLLCALAAVAPFARQRTQEATPAPLEISQRPGSLLRKVNSATRKLHPAPYCFRGAGFSIEPRPIDIDEQGRRWSVFIARKENERMEVRERIYNLHGESWTDVSSWWWQAAFGKSQGPWWAETVVRDRFSS